MKLIVGLGNPGKQYEGTRHNVGFMFIDKLINQYGMSEEKNKFGGIYYQTTISNEKIIFLKPQEYINLSGVVVRKFVDYFKIELDDILIINDDLDLDVGKIKLKSSGSSGGHNGLKNIEQMLGTKKYKRLKIGISNDKKMDTKDYVLGKFSENDMSTINEIISIAPQFLDDYLKMSFSDLMTKYNKKQ